MSNRWQQLYMQLLRSGISVSVRSVSLQVFSLLRLAGVHTVDKFIPIIFGIGRVVFYICLNFSHNSCNSLNNASLLLLRNQVSNCRSSSAEISCFNLGMIKFQGTLFHDHDVFIGLHLYDTSLGFNPYSNSNYFLINFEEQIILVSLPLKKPLSNITSICLQKMISYCYS